MSSWVTLLSGHDVLPIIHRRTRRVSASDAWAFADAVVVPSLGDALDGLMPDERVVVFLRFAGDLTHAEIAAAVGCTEATSRMRVSRALARLRGDLSTDA